MNTEPLKVIAGTPDRPLVIGDIEIPCYVLEDETRVLSQGGFLRAIGRTGGPKTGHDDLFDLPTFLRPRSLASFISKGLSTSSRPVLFQAATGGTVATGYRASLLPEVCNVFLAARDAGALHPRQQHIARRADILIRGLATVGIIALVDEATGYQDIRAKLALAIILERFIAKELHPWTKTFPYEFYTEIARLKEWPAIYSIKRPSVIGHYTNDIVYDRIAPGLLEELRNVNPPLPTGRRQHRHHQWFTPEFGHPKLKEHLAAVTALMRAAPNWPAFQRSLQRAFRKLNDNLPLPIED
jgi:hypothetical protein